MKTLAKILLALVVLLVVLAVVAMFLPRKANVERSVVIDAPARMVYNQVVDLHSWNKWAVWNQIDPNMKITFVKSGIGQGAGYSWESTNEKVGNGMLTIRQAVPYDSVLIDLDFGGQGIAESPFRFSETEGKTTVTWAFRSDLGVNPVARWMGLMFDSMIGPDLEKGLVSLKTITETMIREKQPQVELVILPETPYISIREQVEHVGVSAAMARIYGELFQRIQTEKLQMNGMPFAIYHSMDSASIDLECGVPLVELPDPDDEVLSGTLPETLCASADHIGSYETLGATHELIQQWLKEHEIAIDGAPIEKYLTDPSLVQDTANWVTVIFYPVNPD